MTVRLPSVPVRAALIDPQSGRLAREWYEFFNALRTSVGGDLALIDPGAQADAFAPVAVTMGDNTPDASPVAIMAAPPADAVPVALAEPLFPDAPRDGATYARRNGLWVTAGSGILTAVKTANESRTSNTLAPDDDLQLTLEADTYYAIQGVLHYTGNTAGDFRAGLTIVSGLSGGVSEFANAANAVAGVPLGGVINMAAAGTTADRLTTFSATFYGATTPGVLAVNWAQQVTNAEASVLWRGSWVTATPL